MPPFLALPRELRDMVYLAILTNSTPFPHPQSTNPPWAHSGWLRHAFEASSWDEYSCVYSARGVPRTCANLLAVNRQLNAEMNDAIQLTRKKGALKAHIDVLATFCGKHYVTWRSLPLVHTVRGRSNRDVLAHVPVVGRFLGAAEKRSTTRIEVLQIDVRSVGYEGAARCGWAAGGLYTSWSVCEMLRSVLEREPCGPLGNTYPADLFVDTLIVNIVLLSPTSTATSQQAEHDFISILTQDLISVWNSLWAANDARAKRYRVLLERIERVRVCVGEKVVRERELKAELERGRRERRRIDLRVGW